MPNPMVTLIGRLGADPEPVGSGLRLRIATSEGKLNPATNKWEDGPTSWWTVKAWKSVAEQCKDVLKKGQEIVVYGQMYEETWKAKDGSTKSSYEVTARSIGVSSYSLSRDLVGASSNNGFSTNDVWNTSEDTPF